MDPGKNFDRTGAFGPEMVTAYELPPGATRPLHPVARNGALMQDGNTADMMFPVARTISLISEIMTWEPGDVIAMGTPAGVGYARTPPVWLRDGDRCEIEIEGIGTLANTATTTGRRARSSARRRDGGRRQTRRDGRTDPFHPRAEQAVRRHAGAALGRFHRQPGGNPRAAWRQRRGQIDLIKIFAGVYTADSGEILIGGTPRGGAGDRRLAFVHQDLGLIETMSVGENMAMGYGYPRRWNLIDWRSVRRTAEAALDFLGSPLPLDRPVAELSRAEKSIVAIARALTQNVELLVLDEPTASLPEADVGRLFRILARCCGTRSFRRSR